jgi:hypothetical protein
MSAPYRQLLGLAKYPFSHAVHELDAVHNLMLMAGCSARVPDTNNSASYLHAK